ncbi:MAG: ATP-binding protein, partial [bacterium]
GRRPPEVQEGQDRVVVRIFKRIIQPEIIDFIQKVEKEYHPTLKEVLVLGTLAQHESLTARELAKALELPESGLDASWLGRLDGWGLVSRKGRTRGVRYRVEPEVLRKTQFKGATSLRRIEDHRLRELILEDLRIYKKASRTEIHARIGAEIPTATVIRILDALVVSGTVLTFGNTRARKYQLPI